MEALHWRLRCFGRSSCEQIPIKQQIVWLCCSSSPVNTLATCTFNEQTFCPMVPPRIRFGDLSRCESQQCPLPGSYVLNLHGKLRFGCSMPSSTSLRPFSLSKLFETPPPLLCWQPAACKEDVSRVPICDQAKQNG